MAEEKLDIGYYERMGGPVYGPGNWPKEWIEEVEKMILKAVEDGINEDIEKDKSNKHEKDYITQFAETYLSALSDPSFTGINAQRTYHGLYNKEERAKSLDPAPEEITLEWNCQPFSNDTVNKVAEDMKKNMNNFIDGKMVNPISNLTTDWDGDYIWDQSLGSFRAPKYPGEEGDKINFDKLRFNNECDLLLGNKPKNDSDIQYPNCIQCHRYEICKKYYNSKERIKLNDKMY